MVIGLNGLKSDQQIFSSLSGLYQIGVFMLVNVYVYVNCTQSGPRSALRAVHTK